MISINQNENIICTIHECGENLTPAAVMKNKNEKSRSHKSKENTFTIKKMDQTVKLCFIGVYIFQKILGIRQNRCNKIIAYFFILAAKNIFYSPFGCNVGICLCYTK